MSNILVALILLYDYEWWTMKAKDENRIRAPDMKLLR
jgi:hypothetical protein